MGLLEQAHIICLEKSDVSKDASRVARAVRLILDSGRVFGPQTGGLNVTLSKAPASSSTGIVQGGVDLTNLSLQPQIEPLSFQPLEDVSFDTLDPFSFMCNEFDDVNWMAFEPQMGIQSPSSKRMDPTGRP